MKKLVKCLGTHLTPIATVFGLSVTKKPNTQTNHTHIILLCVTDSLEVLFALLSFALVFAYWYFDFNLWKDMRIRICQTASFSAAFTSLMMALISLLVPGKQLIHYIIAMFIIAWFFFLLPLFCVESSEDVPVVGDSVTELESAYLDTKSSFLEEGNSVLKAKCEATISDEDFYDLAEMVHALRRLSFAVTLDNANLVNILATGHTIILKARSCRRVFNGRERNIESEDEQEVRMMAELEHQLKRKCNELVSLIDQHFIPSTECAESLVFLHKMKGDYFHYLAELREGLNSDAFRSLEAYEKAIKIAALALSPSNPIRLSLALNCAVFHYEILNSRRRAYEIARLAYDEAVTSEISYPDSNVVMERIKGKLISWSNHVVEKGENKSRVPAGGVRWFFWN